MSLLKKEDLINPDGSEYTSSLEGKKVLFYFSASWCPPCRQFSPMLIEWYKKHKDDSFEAVFVSSDRDPASFKEYAGHFPFPAVKYEDRALKEKLSKVFGVQGIPTVGVCDESGGVITNKAREGVMADPENFPWAPKSLQEILSTGPLLKGDEKIEDAVAYFKGKKVAVYFSASWCGPCVKFSPMLKECYETLHASGHSEFEVLFVTADREEDAFNAYRQKLPGVALPFQDERVAALSQHFEVQGIPTCLLLDGDELRVLHKDLRSAIVADPKGAKFPWKPEAVNAVDAAFMGDVNDVANLLIFAPSDRAHFDEVLRPTATRVLQEAEAAKKSAPLRFAIADPKEEIVSTVSEFLQLNAFEKPGAVLLDIPNGRKFVFRNVELTAEWVAQTTEAFLNDKLEGSLGIRTKA